MRCAALCLALWLLPGAMAQDERRVSSPNGEIEFRISIVGSQKDTTFSRLAYQVLWKGKPVVGTSFLGLDIYEQEPILGENVGLTSSAAHSTPKYHSLLLEYMQNGSTGRRISVEVRAYDEGVAFRYIVPKSAMLERPVIDEELTEFRIAGFQAAGRVPLPVRIPQARGWIEIDELRDDQWPAMYLIQGDGDAWISNLAQSRDKPEAAFTGNAPVTCPWRLISIAEAGNAAPTSMLSDLRR
jgi:alpha-glucosidase